MNIQANAVVNIMKKKKKKERKRKKDYQKTDKTPGGAKRKEVPEIFTWKNE